MTRREPESNSDQPKLRSLWDDDEDDDDDEIHGTGKES